MEAILIMAVLIEAVISYIKAFAVDKKICWQVIVSVVFSVLICIAYNLDIPAAIGVCGSVRFVGNIITGILVSRGSNYIYDVLSKLTVREG